jgi:plasmid maintenance system antidote protein VapI
VSDAAAAKWLGVSRSHLSRVLSRQKPIADRLALALGYERQDLFVPYEER